MTDQPKDSKWLDEILKDFFNDCYEGIIIDKNAFAYAREAILTHVKHEVLLGKIEEVAKARNAWHGTTDKEFADEMNDRLAELEQQLKDLET